MNVFGGYANFRVQCRYVYAIMDSQIPKGDSNMKAYERFLNYVVVHTASSEDSSSVPTTERQFDLARMLVSELRALGVEDAEVDDK